MNVTVQHHYDYLTPLDAVDEAQKAEVFRLKYPKACSGLETKAEFFKEVVEEARRHEAWKWIGLSSFEEFCERELGRTLAEVEEIVAGVRHLQASGKAGPITASEAIAAAGRLGKRGANQHTGGSDNVRSYFGNAASYLAARLKRDHPEICKRAEAGEFKSVRQAAIAAGIVKPKPPIEQAKSIFAKLSQDDRAAFMAWIREQAT